MTTGDLSAQVLLPGTTVSGPGIEASGSLEGILSGTGALPGHAQRDFYLDGSYGGTVLSDAFPNVLTSPYFGVDRFTLSYRIGTSVFIGDVTEFSLPGFAHHDLYVVELSDSGQPAVSVTRSEGEGDRVTFTFGPPYAPIPGGGGWSRDLVVHTTATRFTTGFATLTTLNGTTQVEVLVPDSAAVPEPVEYVVAAASGLLALMGWRCRRTQEAL